MRYAELDRVKHFVESVVDSNDLDVLEVTNSATHKLVILECVKERTISIGRKLDIMVALHQDLARRIHSRQHRLGEEDEGTFFSTEEGIVTEVLNCLIVVLVARHHKHGAFLARGGNTGHRFTIVRID